MRYNQEAYYQKYGSDVMFTFAPKTDTMLVIILIVCAVNGFVYFAQYNKWRKVCERLAKAAVEDWSPAMGGSAESRQLRQDAMELLAEAKKDEKDSDQPVATKGG